jgi:hypothetical protein
MLLVRTVANMTRRIPVNITILSALVVVSGCGASSNEGGAGQASSVAPSAPAAPVTSAPAGTAGNSDDASTDYCAQYGSFAGWSIERLGAITAEAATADFTVRDAYFDEQLERIESMQRVAPAELTGPLDVLHQASELYLAHDLAGAATLMRANGTTMVALNDYGRDTCGIDPLQASQG